MGVIALGIGFASPLALAGVAVHIVGHAIAKALGFYAATPLIGHEPRAAGHAATGIARTQPRLAASLGISLGTLAGLPPSPLFASEVLIVAGGFQAGYDWAAGCATVLLALGFLGLVHALLETTAGKARHRAALPVPGPARRDRARLDLGRAAARARRGRVLAARQRARGGAREGDLVSAGYREAVGAALAEGWRFGGLHASAGGSLVRTLLVAPDGATRLETVDVARRARAVGRRPRAGGRLGRARGGRPPRDRLRRARAAATAARPRRAARPLDRARARPRPVRRRGRADPRRRDRVGPLPLPRRRRPHPPRRRPALLQAPRARARRRGRDARGGTRLRRARVRGVRGHELGRLRARLRGGARPRPDAGARARADDPARARARVEPPERRRRDLRRLRAGRGQPAGSRR